MKQQKPPKGNNNLKNFAILSGVAFQMGITIFLAVKGGQWLDGHYQQGKLFTIICTLAGVAISLYIVVQQLKRLNQ